MPYQPRPGDVIQLDAHASVQFAGDRAIRLMVAALDQRPTYAGWVWLRGYVLNAAGLAVGQREVFVWKAGLHKVAA